MASEPADVLIIGAGASGAVVALRLAEAGFKVTCLEQGEWLNRADYPGNKLDWELKARKDWATSPNLRGLASDYPIVEDDTPVSPLMYNAVGGSTIIFAGAWPRDCTVRGAERSFTTASPRPSCRARSSSTRSNWLTRRSRCLRVRFATT